MAATEDVHMQVEHRLAGLGAVVEHHPKMRDAFLDGDFIADPYHFTHHLLILRADRRRAAEMFFRDYEKMNRRLRRDIAEGEHLVVFVQLAGRDFSPDNFAEQAVISRGGPPVVRGNGAGYRDTPTRGSR